MAAKAAGRAACAMISAVDPLKSLAFRHHTDNLQMESVQTCDEKAFSKDVISRWGTLSDDLEYDENLLHPQLAALGRLCSESPENCSEILAFLERILARRDVIDEIENAIAISFMRWPDLKAATGDRKIAPEVMKVVRIQWERFGFNF